MNALSIYPYDCPRQNVTRKIRAFFIIQTLLHKKKKKKNTCDFSIKFTRMCKNNYEI